MLPIALAALCAWAGTTPTLETKVAEPFRIERAVACRGIRGGLPVDGGSSFQVGQGRVCIWFAGREGSRATPVQADVWREAPVHRIARCALTVPPRSPGGMFNLRLESGSSLPAGSYRVQLAAPGSSATVRFAVVEAGAEVPLAPPSRSRTLTDPAHGFSVEAPPGWDDTVVEAGALALARAGEPQAVAMVIVRNEPKATTAAEIAAQLARALGEEVDYLVISRREGFLGERRTAALLIDRADGERLKVVVVPREPGASARTFFGLILTCTGDDFGSVEPEFDGIVSSFRVLPVSPP